MPITTHVTDFGAVTIGPDYCGISADGAQLWAWAHRLGAACPCSTLADLDSISVGFDSGGLVDLEQSPAGPDPEPSAPMCPDCGEAITLNPSGWWSHDRGLRGSSGECWRVSMDGPDADDDGIEIDGNELSAWSSDVLGAVLPTDHPCYVVCVGQFIDRSENAR